MRLESVENKGSNGEMFFFFKQKTAYEVLGSLVGSEMCIRDRGTGGEVVNRQ